VGHTAEPSRYQLHTSSYGGSVPFSAAGSACDVGARAGAEDGHFACAVGTAVRATYTTSCIQLLRPHPAAVSERKSACV